MSHEQIYVPIAKCTLTSEILFLMCNPHLTISKYYYNTLQVIRSCKQLLFTKLEHTAKSPTVSSEQAAKGPNSFTG